MSEAVHPNRFIRRDMNTCFRNEFGNQPLHRTAHDIKRCKVPDKYTWTVCLWAAMLEVINDCPAHIFEQWKF